MEVHHNFTMTFTPRQSLKQAPIRKRSPKNQPSRLTLSRGGGGEHSTEEQHTPKAPEKESAAKLKRHGYELTWIAFLALAKVNTSAIRRIQSATRPSCKVPLQSGSGLPEF